MREIKIIDTTFRDGNQSLWATRMTTAMMLRVAERMDRIGFFQLDIHSALHVDVCVRFLKEDPWERLRLLRAELTRTPLRMGFRSGNLTGFSTRPPEDFVELWVKTHRDAGISVFWCHDGLIDIDNIGANLRLVQRHGGYGVAPLTFSLSPVHTDAFYAERTAEVVRKYRPDSVMIKDSCGLLTPDRARTLIPMMREAASDTPLELHSHSLTGLAPLVYLEAVALGIDRLHACIAPLADGPALPAVQDLVWNLKTLGHKVELDEALIDEVSADLRLIAERTGKPQGQPAPYDAFHYKHQIPGGMLTNFKVQLEQSGMLDRLPEVLTEVARVREELGWVPMVTPFSQLVGVQAMLNVIKGERYGVVADEIKRYALGHYGRPPTSLEPRILERIISNGSSKILPEPEVPQPVVGKLRERYPHASDKELVLHFLFEGHHLEALRAAGPIIAHDPTFEREPPLRRLLREIGRRPALDYLHVQKGSDSLTLSRGQPALGQQAGDGA